MISMAHLLHKLLCANKDLLDLKKLDLSTVFNHCLILVSNLIRSVKDLSSMGWRTDITYDYDGN